MLFCATQIHQVLARALLHLSGEECAVSGPGIENARHGSSRVPFVPRALVQKEPGYPFRLRRKFRFAKRRRGIFLRRGMLCMQDSRNIFCPTARSGQESRTLAARLNRPGGFPRSLHENLLPEASRRDRWGESSSDDRAACLVETDPQRARCSRRI